MPQKINKYDNRAVFPWGKVWGISYFWGIFLPQAYTTFICFSASGESGNPIKCRKFGLRVNL